MASWNRRTVPSGMFGVLSNTKSWVCSSSLSGIFSPGTSSSLMARPRTSLMASDCGLALAFDVRTHTRYDRASAKTPTRSSAGRSGASSLASRGSSSSVEGCMRLTLLPAASHGCVGGTRVPSIRAGDRRPRTALLSPFDSLFANRAVPNRLWGFGIRNERYIPKDKRHGPPTHRTRRTARREDTDELRRQLAAATGEILVLRERLRMLDNRD